MGIRPRFETGGGWEVSRTVLQASSVQELIQLPVEEVYIPILLWFRSRVRGANQWRLSAAGSVGGSVAA